MTWLIVEEKCHNTNKKQDKNPLSVFLCVQYKYCTFAVSCHTVKPINDLFKPWFFKPSQNDLEFKLRENVHKSPQTKISVRK